MCTIRKLARLVGTIYGMDSKIHFITISILICCLFLWSADAVARQVMRYNGPGNNNDYPNAISVDNNGNVYVIGSSERASGYADYIIVKYDTSGKLSWSRRYNGLGNRHDEAMAMTVDDNGNIYVTGEAYSDVQTSTYTTIKYDPNGERLWLKEYAGSQYNSARAIAVDKSGNSYVTGNSGGAFATIKYSADGSELWVKHYNTYRNDTPISIGVDRGGNVYVTGRSTGCGGGGCSGPAYYDYTTIKYDPNGELMWSKVYHGPVGRYDVPKGMAVDNTGNVYVTGYSLTSGGWTYFDFDYATIKYDSDGELRWEKRYGGAGNDSDYASAIAVDKSGNVYVTGYSPGDDGIKFDYVTIKYKAGGKVLWMARYSGPDNASDIATGISVDESGSVYVTGYSYRDKWGRGYATVKYSADGEQLWVRQYNGHGNGDDVPVGIATDSGGNSYVTGYSAGETSYYDFVTIKYGPNGE